MTKKDLLKLLDELKLLVTDLNRLIIEYTELLLSRQVQEVEIESCWKMATDQKHLYIGTWRHPRVLRYALNTFQHIDTFNLKSASRGLDLFENELYVSEANNTLSIFSVSTKDLIRQWHTFQTINAIKYYKGNLYCAGHDGIIVVYNLLGDLIQQFGKKGTGNGEFFYPHGIEVDNKFIYIADSANDRIQVHHLENFSCSHQWGGIEQLRSPHEIRLYEDVYYVSNLTCIRLYTKDGQLLLNFDKSLPGSGMIKDFGNIGGMLMINNYLYVSDIGNGRIVLLE